MRRLAVLTTRPDLEVHRELAEAAARRGHRLDVLDACTLVARSAPQGVVAAATGAEPSEIAAVLPRVGNWRPDSTLAILAALRASGVASLNSPAAIRRGRDHWRTAAALAAAAVPHPVTLAGAEPEALAAAAGRACGFPCVVKQRRSRQGVGVVLCPDPAALEAVLDALWRVGDEVVVQRFIAPGGVSRRVLVLDGEALGAAEHRARAGEFRTNAARGADVRRVEVGSLGALAVAACAAVGLDFAGVDLLPDGERWVVGEVNPSPGWAHFRAATGVAVADRLVEALLRRGDDA
ncbi:MAG: ATP-grasp domain-containing protein [Acidobacteriota bacterium]